MDAPLTLPPEAAARFKAEDDRRAAYYRRIETLLDPLPTPVGNDDIGCVLNSVLCQARRLAMALTRYPRFDIEGLARYQRPNMTLEVRQGGKLEPVSLELWLPAFAAVDYPGGTATANVDYVNHPFGVSFDNARKQENRRIAAEAGLDASDLYNMRIQATAPAVPQDVERRIDAIRPDFDRLHLVFEAEWAPAAKADPLVLGEISVNHHPHFFLVDRFDVTKLERYVVGEFGRGPVVP